MKTFLLGLLALPLTVLASDTVKAAAKRIVKAIGVPVNVGYNAAKYPNAILLSRGVLSNRGRRSS